MGVRVAIRLVRVPGALLEMVRGREAAAERRRLRTEIQAFEAFSRELFVGLDELIHARLRELNARTLVGATFDV